MMISSKKLIKMARKWRKLALSGRKRISFPSHNGDANNLGSCSSNSSRPSSVVDKCHFVIYTADHRRFVIPLSYLNHQVFRKLLEMSGFGLPREGPIVLPCDAVFVEYIISLICQGIAANIQQALLLSLATTSGCSSENSWRCLKRIRSAKEGSYSTTMRRCLHRIHHLLNLSRHCSKYSTGFAPISASRLEGWPITSPLNLTTSTSL